MQSASPRGPFPDRAKEQTVPAGQNDHSSDESEAVGANQDAGLDKRWTPKFDRRQSWSQEDQKHQMQERLLGVEQGPETGFSETRQDH
ncbi:uncharacterized protein N7459_006671 [Penicillium hispanicum]|uniref:uncharacterized protein n=1 Tax=Penicillium hispanicum TaxID=1080232 RepID=UPI00253FB862|nr:uncharacterized protein N7459_006671 [Penicillium hispanicum]KAJ5577707.1 hypothetical protein N7459_006671 [Penicillium hispanicum]